MAEATVAYNKNPNADWTSLGKQWGWNDITQTDNQNAVYISSITSNHVTWESAPATDELEDLNGRINF